MTPEELLKQIDIDINKVKAIEAAYIYVYKDVLQGLNLDKHLKDVEAAIIEIDKSISIAEGSGENTNSLRTVRLELFKLKFEILEILQV